MIVVGISATYHDAAAAVLRNGQVVAAAQEERFTRVKNDPRLPKNALAWCLAHAGVEPDGIGAVAFYEKPLTTFGRVLRSFVDAGPRGWRSFPEAMSEWAGNKLWTSLHVERMLREMGYRPPPGRILMAEHHESHAASAFYPSPYESACILTFDGVGEWATTSIGRGVGASIDILAELRFPASLGLLYSTFTQAAGFRVNSGEYKLMGLAPFGNPSFAGQILDNLIDLHDDGSFELNMDYFDFLAGARMTGSAFRGIFGPDRVPESPITQRDCDLARSVQEVIEMVVLRMGRHAHDLTGERRAVLAGGVALNGVANARLLREGPFDEIWVQPAAGDSGGALGCAQWAWYQVGRNKRHPQSADGMSGALLGPGIDPDAVREWLRTAGYPSEPLADRAEQYRRIAGLLAEGGVVAVAQGSMEFGPRALGSRSILADPRSSAIRATLNASVKRREEFRPFAPSVLAERAGDYFEMAQESPYMSLVVPVVGADVQPERHAGFVDTAGSGLDDEDQDDLVGRLNAVRSPLPAVTHIDGTARVQTVDSVRFPWFHSLLSEFETLTGCPVLLNTSFNIRGEPIVATYEDAYRCFMTTELDWLLVGDSLLSKSEQPLWDNENTPQATD